MGNRLHRSWLFGANGRQKQKNGHKNKDEGILLPDNMQFKFRPCRNSFDLQMEGWLDLI